MDRFNWMVVIFFVTLIICGALQSKQARVVFIWCILTLLCGFLGAAVGFLLVYGSTATGGSSFAALGAFLEALLISSSFGLVVGLIAGTFAAKRVVRWINRPHS